VHTQHPEVQRLILGHAPLPSRVVTTRRLQLLGELQDGPARVGGDRAVADVEHGPAALGEKLRGPLEVLRLRPLGHVIAGQIDRIDKGSITGAGRQILGHVDQHRARPARAGDVESLFDDARNVGRLAHEIAVLDHADR